MSELVCLADLLMGGAGEVQFLDQIAEREWRLEKIGGRKGDGLSPAGQSRTRRVRAFHGLGLFGGARRRR